jgi:hypothetical protein
MRISDNAEKGGTRPAKSSVESCLTAVDGRR